MKNRLAIILILTVALLLFAVLFFIRALPYEQIIATVKPLGFPIKMGDSDLKTSALPKNLLQSLESLVQDRTGNFAVFIEDLDTNQTVSLNSDEEFYAASLYKVPLAISVLQEVEAGNISLTDTLVYQERHFVAGSGVLQQEQFGSEHTINTLLSHLLKNSDNVAQEMLLEVANRSSLYNMMPDIVDIKVTDVALIYEDLYMGNYLNGENTLLLLDYMTGTSFDDRIQVGLPENVNFAHKIGNWPELGVWHDCGIALSTSNSTLICVMSKNTTLEEFVEVASSIGGLLSL